MKMILNAGFLGYSAFIVPRKISGGCEKESVCESKLI